VIISVPRINRIKWTTAKKISVLRWFFFSSFLLITSLYARDNKLPTIIAAIVLVHETSGSPSSPG